jgi:hypothetical protein
MVLLISYDLNGHERPSAYAAVKAMIERHAPDHRKPLYSQWLVNTNDSVTTWQQRMRQVTDPNDYFFICRVTKENDGWLPKNVWEWLNALVPR